MLYHYIATAQPATAVSFAVVCNFTSAESRDLIIARNNSLEVLSQYPVAGSVLQILIQGEIIILKIFKLLRKNK